MMALSRITQERTRLEPTRGGAEERGDWGPEEVAQVSIIIILVIVNITIIVIIIIISIITIIIMEEMEEVSQVSICLVIFHTHVTIFNLDLSIIDLLLETQTSFRTPGLPIIFDLTFLISPGLPKVPSTPCLLCKECWGSTRFDNRSGSVRQ